MENKKDVLRVTMKDINLLPDDFLISSNARTKNKVKAQTEEVKVTASDDSSVQSEKVKESVAALPKNIKENILDSIQQNSGRAASFINSLKK